MSAAAALQQSTLRQFMQARDALWARLSVFDWVSGVDLGLPPTMSSANGDQIVLRLHLRDDVVLSRGQRAMIPTVVAGIAVHQVCASYHSGVDATRPAVAAPVASVRVQSGNSIGRLCGATGTAGLLVLDRQTRQPGVLSSWQVLAGECARRGDPVVHPGLADADISDSDHIANLSRWMRDWDGDGAFARLEAGRRWHSALAGQSVSQTGTVIARAVAPAAIGMTLRRFGRGEGVTASVDGIGIYRRHYQNSDGSLCCVDMEGILLRETPTGAHAGAALCGAGHQGALWALADNEHCPEGATGVGLQCARSQSGDAVILSDLATVLKRLDLILPDAAPGAVALATVDGGMKTGWGSVGDFFEYCVALEHRRDASPKQREAG